MFDCSIFKKLTGEKDPLEKVALSYQHQRGCGHTKPKSLFFSTKKTKREMGKIVKQFENKYHC